MIEKLLQKEIQEFIIGHQDDDEKLLVLKQKFILGIPSNYIADQISTRRKSKTKLPLYFNNKNIVYPPGLNFEQSSSEKTALFKAKILSTMVNTKTLIDLTGGFGIDSFFLSQIFQNVIHVEPNHELQQIAKHNHKILGAANISYINSSAEDYIENKTEKIDCVFIDPSRRSHGQKVFRISDCEPNVAILLPKIFEQTNHALIKTSPLLDIQNGLLELSGVEKVWVVSVDNECKEVLFLCNKSFAGEALISAVNLSEKNHGEFKFTLSVERGLSSTFSEPLNFLYEPNASILKAGAFKSIGDVFRLKKIQINTHLYTSTDLIDDFPGRTFKIITTVKEGKDLKNVFPDSKANIISRNYPLSPEELKKKLKMKDGGELYLLAFSGENKKHMVACERIS